MAGSTHDDGFHEIQLNGKQLVFLFMAVTVVSVVIFLSGVLVGRGVRIDRGGSVVEAAVGVPGAEAPPVPADVPGNTSQPAVSSGEVSYPARLESATPPSERLPKPEPPPVRSEAVADVSPAPASAGTRAESTPSDPPVATAGAPAEKAAPTEPPGGGVAIQVFASKVRREADALANRLIAKGYSAYVVAPGSGAPALYRVRVGKFKDAREAGRVMDRLKKEEQFDPWIVR